MSESIMTSASTKNDDSIDIDIEEEQEEGEEEETEQKNGDAPSQIQMESKVEKEMPMGDSISESTKAFINHFEKDIERIFHNAADSRVSEKAVLYGIDAMMWTLEAGNEDD
jgi:hypothetical protein